ncbi:hypothetical protein PASE110613_14500 [Paenibacillus sediminis]|uniref:HTH merR-type domain-containing protein n=1 Tax=Paenibacillus sediminis TaxID=664909 RepID=A0ABS4H809_9BACL|nr:hypothetical protein [Paenibacillus sediminis]MBP1938502.1 hypothetical protein [Paenibacillus sediminis]
MQSYSKEQLEKLTGLNIRLIQQWIDENRFIGITRENQDQINDLTLVCFVTGAVMSVSEIKELYKKNQERLLGGEGTCCG